MGPHQRRQWLSGHISEMHLATNDALRRRSFDGYGLTPQRPDELANGDTAAIDDYWRATGFEQAGHHRLTGQVNSADQEETRWQTS